MFRSAQWIILSVLAIISVAQNPAFAGGINCDAPYLGVDYVICENSDLVQLIDQLNERYLEAKVRLPNEMRDRLIEEQKSWAIDYGPRCGLRYSGRPSAREIQMSYSCIKTEIGRRLGEVNRLLMSFGRANGGFDCSRSYLGVDYTICSDPSLISLIEHLGQIYWRGRSSLAGADRDEYVQSQRDWSSQYGPACGLPAVGWPGEYLITVARPCVEAQIRQRLEVLKELVAEKRTLPSSGSAGVAVTGVPADDFDRVAYQVLMNVPKCVAKKIISDQFDSVGAKAIADFLFVAVVENRVQTTPEVVTGATINALKQMFKDRGRDDIAGMISNAKFAACLIKDTDIGLLFR